MHDLLGIKQHRSDRGHYCRRVTASFDARSQCDSRLYEYSLPEWVFDPDLLTRSSNGRLSGGGESTQNASASPSKSRAAARQEVAAGASDNDRAYQLRAVSSASRPPINSSFRFEEASCARLTAILQQFEGTHNFHNFSPNVCPEQMSAQRCASSTVD
jgi:tRNA U38,U39,U40 pseudouridine synthase TruA